MRADVCRVNDAAPDEEIKSCIIVKYNYVIERLAFKHLHCQLNKADFHHSLDQDLHASGDIQVFDIPNGSLRPPAWSISLRVRAFRKVLVILPTSACSGAASGGLWRAPAGRSTEPHAVYQALYAKGPEREAARHPGQHTLAGGLTSIFSETRTRLQNDHRRGPQHALGAKTTTVANRSVQHATGAVGV